MESGVRRGKKDFYIPVQMGQETNVDKLEDVGETVAEHVADNRDVLVHRKGRTSDSGCLVCFVAACILDRKSNSKGHHRYGLS